MESGYVCIHCGEKNQAIYKQYKNSAKLLTCSHCLKTVDFYIEYDNVLICLSLLLHNTQAYRHVLFNKNIQNYKRLILLYLLTQAYVKWCCHPHTDFGMNKHYIWQWSVQKHIYAVLFITLFEMLVKIYFLVALSQYYYTRRYPFISGWCLFRVVVLASYGVLFNIAGLVWCHDDLPLTINLTQIFLATSLSQAIAVSTRMPLLLSMLIVLLATVVSTLLSSVAMALFV